MTAIWPDPIVELRHPDTWATIRYVGDGFELSWNDGVVNQWDEVWPRLDIAIMRLALLMYCGQSDWYINFTTFAGGFNGPATEFAEHCLTFFGQHAE